jgi:hypothetical protein
MKREHKFNLRTHFKEHIMFVIWGSPVIVRVRVTLWLAVYRESARFGAKPFEVHDQSFFFITELLLS